MGATLDNCRNGKAIGGKFAPVIEIVGPAGAGKTTLASALARRNKKIRIVDAPYFRKIGDLPFFFWNTLLLLPTFSSFYFNHFSVSPTRRQLAWMATLNGWDTKLRNLVSDHEIKLLDQGPIFLIGQLLYFGPEIIRCRKAEKWLTRMTRKYAAVLDQVFFLDASDRQLIERIRGRDKWHVMKEEPDSIASEFLAQYRIAYERVISMLGSYNNNLKVVYFDTGLISIDGMVNRIVDEYDLKDQKVGVSDSLSPVSD